MSVIGRGNLQAVFNTRDGLFIHRVEHSTSREHGVAFSAAEAEKLVQMVLSVLRVETLPLLPRTLKASPFESEFGTDRTIELRRREQRPDSGLRFRFEEADDLIWLVEQAKVGYIADGQAKPRAPGHAYWPTPDAPIDGR